MLAEKIRNRPQILRTFIAFVVFPLLFAGITAVVMFPLVHGYRTHSDWQQKTRRMIAKNIGLIATRSETQAQVEAIEKSLLITKLFSDTDAGSANNALQAEVRSLMSSANANLLRMDPVPFRPHRTLRRIAVRIQTEMTIDQIKNFFTSTTSSPHLLRIERLAINAPAVQGLAENPVLSVSMEIAGYQLVEESHDTTRTASNLR